jgi:glycosyltransferase involved in cell wall biosynthesis
MKPKNLKILVSCYACSPNKGSEPGMGWNFVKGLSAYHEVHVIVEKRKWEQPITAYLEANPALSENLKFYFVDKLRSKKLRKIWPPSYYWFYKKWQQKAYKLAESLDSKEHFDLVHQLNMVGYREPGYLYKMDKPFVWGPIGGLENSPWSFLPSLGLKGMLFYAGRNVFNSMQRTFKARPKKAATRTKATLIAATPETARSIKRLWNKDATVICEVGQETLSDFSFSKREANQPLKIVWSGMHTPGKNLTLLLNALKEIAIPFELHILGTGEMTTKWKKQAYTLNISEHCIWYGWQEREKAIQIMKEGHLFCITSISDLTSTVTLEAISYGVPIVCLDHCGFGHVVNENCGIKIPVVKPKQAIEDFAAAIVKVYNDEPLRQKMAEGALSRSQDFLWSEKINKLNGLYAKLLDENTSNT